MKNGMKNSDVVIRWIGNWITEEKERTKKLHYKFSRRLGNLSGKQIPEHIRVTRAKSSNSDTNAINYGDANVMNYDEASMYYLEVWNEDGIRKSRYLGKDTNPAVQNAKEKKFLEEALKELDKNRKALDSCAKNLRRFDVEAVNDSLPKAYRLSQDNLARIAGEDEEDEWYRKAQRIREEDLNKLGYYYKIQLKQTAKDGTKMRSKSEVLIANTLIDRGIKYIYELPLVIKNVPIRPDFTFYSYSRGKVMMWEHAGMLGDESYRVQFADRISKYLSGGYVPGVDVIVTFDTVDGSVDSRLINRVIDEYM